MASFSAEGLLKMPPPIADDDPAGSRPPPGPGSILLDPYGYLSSRTNGSTAEGFTRDGRAIRVTFWVATPPRVSSFTIHCPGFQPSVPGDLPKAISSHDDLALFRFPIAATTGHRNDDDGDISHYFVYQAGGTKKNTPPSLHLVPIPRRLEFDDHEAVLLRCRDDVDQEDDGMFYLALLLRVFHFKYDDKQYNLHLYNSRTGTWSTKLTKIDYDYSPREDFDFRHPNAALTIGGDSGTVGWVDLWRGILVCHLLLPADKDNHVVLRYIPLPSPLVPKLRGYALYYRNITVLGDHIRFFEMARPPAASNDTGCTTCGALAHQPRSLVAATGKMKISDIGSGNNSWEEDCAINFSEIPVDSLIKFAQMLPANSLKQQVTTTDTKLTLKGLCAGYPALSLEDTDLVYVMPTPDPSNSKDKASVIAVDLRNKTVKDVAYFGSGRYLGYNYACLQSGISKHLNI